MRATQIYTVGAGAALIATLIAVEAEAGSFDGKGQYEFDPSSVVKQSFENYELESDVLAAVEDGTALHGAKVLKAALKEKGQGIEINFPQGKGAYQLRFWMRGDCVSGAAVDYSDGRPGTLASAFPTGRLTSDNWIEMETSAFSANGVAGISARLFLSPYSAEVPTIVYIDAVEVVPSGAFQEANPCATTSDCGTSQLCLSGICREASGWVPPMPPEADRVALVEYWKKKIHDTYGPYLPRKTAMPKSLEALEEMKSATNAVEYWSSFTRAIRYLKDSHTYTRSLFQSEIGEPRPLNACFFEGNADLSQGAWATQSGSVDILVSHVGSKNNWGLSQGDRLVAVNGLDPIEWMRGQLVSSYWAWAADDPKQVANLVKDLRVLIPRHAKSITVIRCSSKDQTCDGKVTEIEVVSIPQLGPGETAELVGCDNRPFYHVDGAPQDHNFGSPISQETRVVEGPLLNTMPEEKMRGLVWNDLLGGWPGSEMDQKLNAAVKSWQTARGVVQDHREGHGGTSDTANILVSFSRKPFIPLASLTRDRANDEGPIDETEGKALFEQIKGYAGNRAGSASAREDIPVALLTTWDVSASDFLPYLMKGGSTVKIFGPGPTMGAFGTFFQYSYWGALVWSIGGQDSLTPEGLTLCGRGVEPDEKVVPKQSDLLAGQDTVHEAAVAWLRTVLAP